MKTSSAKQKGRLHQQWTRDQILKAFPDLEKDDVRSLSMGAGGEDILLSPKAREYFPFSVECKSLASFAFYKHLDQAKTNAPEGVEPLLVCKANRKNPVVIVDAEYFFNMIGKINEL